MENLREFIEKVNTKVKFSGCLNYNEPMASHTTFKVGGNADIWIKPGKEVFLDYVSLLLALAREEGFPVFILGAGANIVCSDRGIRGIVLDTGFWEGCTFNKNSVSVFSGTQVDNLADTLAESGFSGLEFLAGLPGSVGGAVWMNARCYEKSVSDVLIETEILDENFKREVIPFNADSFSYKKSPFQERDVLILRAGFSIKPGEKETIKSEMAFFREDREKKGHYRFPSAGSAFKNSRDFGAPTGKIIDELGLKGFSVGGAQVAPWHGNIIINKGNATASDIKKLMDEISKKVNEKLKINLESEILFIGEW